MKQFRKIAPSLVLIFSSFFIVEILNYLDLWDSELIPTFQIILVTIYENSDSFMASWLDTFRVSLQSLAISFVLGVTLALIFSLQKWIYNAIFPLAVFFQTVPIIAIAPLLVIYFGYGDQTIRASAVFVSLFPVLASTLVGLGQVPQDWLNVFKIYQKSKFQTLLFLRLPSAYTHIFSGLKIASGLSVVGVVAGEFVAGGGLGALIDTSRTQQRIDLVYAALLGLALIGFIQLGLINFFQFLIEYWRPFRVK